MPHSSVDRAGLCAGLSSRALFLAGAGLAVACLTTLGACERRGVEERTVDKGVENVPERQTPAPPASAAPGEGEAGSDWPWTVPAEWAEDTAPRQMRLATYMVPDPAGDVEVAMSRFGGRVGGELANINRWRGQMGLPPIGEGELEDAIDRFRAPGFEGYEARIESATGVMLASGVYEEAIDQTWFVRTTLSGPEVADRVGAEVFGVARSIAGDEIEHGG